MRFSIIIPTYEMNGTGVDFLNQSLESILIQSFNDYEIVISDHSQDDKIYKLIIDYAYHNPSYPFRYFKYEEKYGNGVSNLNNVLKKAEGEIIKIMFQDDFMFDRRCLEKFNKAFQNEETKWTVCGCNHTRDGLNFERFMVPCWNDRLLEGVNTISSPSVLAFRNENIELFDENLTMLMDVAYYYQLGERYGLPTVIEDCLVTNRCHENQISNKYSGNLGDEVRYCKEKYE